jgi:putative addiction module component (TIGR02574 family)
MRHGGTFSKLGGSGSVMKRQTQDDLLKLPKRDRLDLAERLWLSVVDEHDLEVPETHKTILKTRLADYESGKSKPISHDEFMRRVQPT